MQNRLKQSCISVKVCRQCGCVPSRKEVKTAARHRGCRQYMLMSVCYLPGSSDPAWAGAGGGGRPTATPKQGLHSGASNELSEGPRLARHNQCTDSSWGSCVAKLEGLHMLPGRPETRRWRGLALAQGKAHSMVSLSLNA